MWHWSEARLGPGQSRSRSGAGSEHGGGGQGAGVRGQRGSGLAVRAVLQGQELGERRQGCCGPRGGWARRGCFGGGELKRARAKGAPPGANGAFSPPQWVASIDLAENEDANANVVVRTTESFPEQAEQVGARRGVGGRSLGVGEAPRSGLHFAPTRHKPSLSEALRPSKQ